MENGLLVSKMGSGAATAIQIIVMIESTNCMQKIIGSKTLFLATIALGLLHIRDSTSPSSNGVFGNLSDDKQ